MDALILAAGRGTRMGNLEMPKCLLDLGGITILDYQIKCFKQVGIKNIFIVTGYNYEMISNHLNEKVTFLHNPDFASTNNLYSLWAAKDVLKDDFVCVYSDLFFHQKILQKCISDENQICLAVERNIRDETMRVRIKNNLIVEVNKQIPLGSANGNFIGMSKFKKNSILSLFESISKLISENNLNSYYTLAIEDLIKNDDDVNFIETENLPWMDIDEQSEIIDARKLYQKTFGVES